jgi:diguanylate cyclase (GGDEF)-like protein
MGRRVDAYSWICRDQRERERFLDLHAPLVAVNGRILAVLVLCIAAAFPALEDPLALLPAALGIGVFGAVQRRYRRFRRPEVWVFWAVLGGEVSIAIALLQAGLVASPALALLAWPVVGVALRFHDRVVAAGTAFAMALVAGMLWVERDELAGGAQAIPLALAALFAVATIASVHRDSDVRQRGSATLDPLTGLLNRTALNQRVAEVAAQSRITREPVAVIVADLDRFKAVNDEHGHAAGDAVLVEVAARLRGTLRAYDLVYRIGGEEFVVVVLGQDAPGAARLAELLRWSIAETPVNGLPITASFGVAATAPGAAFAWDAVFAEADAALYRAKADGRDRVRAAGLSVAA